MAKGSGGTKSSSWRDKGVTSSTESVTKEINKHSDDDGYVNPDKVFLHKYDEQVAEKIYEQGGDTATDKEIKAGKIKEVSVDKIYPIQQTLYKDRMLNIVESVKKNGIVESKAPIVTEYKGNYYVLDGNHRTAVAIMLGYKKIKVNVVKKI